MNKKKMQNTKKKTSGNEDSKKKERHIVTWTQEVPFLILFHSHSIIKVLFLFFFFSFIFLSLIPWWVLVVFQSSSLIDGFLTWVFLELQEDDILRQQISLHGTEKYDILLISFSGLFGDESICSGK